MLSKNFLTILLLVIGTLWAENFDTYKLSQQHHIRVQKEEFAGYKAETEAAFNQYIQELDRVYSAYRQELQQYWSEPVLSSKKQWVSYTPDKKTRSTVDFAQREIVLETIAANPETAHNNLRNALRRTITIDTKKAFETDPLQQRIMKITKPKTMTNPPLKSEPILSDILFDTKPTQMHVHEYISNSLKTNKIMHTSPTKNNTDQRYLVRIALPKNLIHKRSVTYQKTIAFFSHEFKLPAPLIFAVIHTESSYNPFATSHIPAYGLMQIVPQSAGVDTYLFLHKKNRIPSPQYLYNSRNNIEMGSGYLHLLYYRYLKDIKNKNSRLYCTIAAYNTGAGNVAYAFSGTYSIDNALSKINAMKPEDVYKYLHKHLRYDEPKIYLQRVIQQMIVYHKIYGEKGTRKQTL